MLKPVHNLKDVLRYSWSFRLAVLASILTFLEMVLPIFLDRDPSPIMLALIFFVTVGASIARLVAQQTISGPQKEDPE